MPYTYAVTNRFNDFYLRGVAYVPPTTLYVGYSSTAPSPDGTGATEPGGGYARVGVAQSTLNWTPSAGGLASCLQEVLFPEPSGSQGVIIYVCLWDIVTVSAGELQAYEALAIPRTIDGTSVPVRFRIGDLRFKFPVS